jgi:hypothetical protein
MIFRNTLTCAFAIACSMSATIPAWGQQEAERQVQVDAAIGQTMRLRGHVNYSHGCSDVIPTDITVIQAPLYGTLTIKNEVVHAKDAELGRGCVGSSGMGKVVYYTCAHEGTDSFSYDSASSNGVVHVYVTVRSARTSGPAAAEPSTAQPALPTPAQLIAGEPMHIALVRAQGPGCDPNCPTWITASGKIVPGTAEKLRQVIQSLAGRRLPILVNSPGGFVADAMAMGRLIRRSGFSVAVADTSLAVCQPIGKCCEDQRASTSFGAICESACSLVLAGGVRRYVSGYSVVGVHELVALRTVTRTLRRYEILYHIVGGRKLEVSRRLVSEESSSHSTVSEAGEDLERSAADYFAEMGVGEPVVRLTALTPSTSIRRLTLGELRESRLATHVLDGPFPIRAGRGSNGLKAISIDDGATGDLLAEAAQPLTLGDGRVVELNIQIRYHPGGGNARVDLRVRHPGTKEGVEAGKNGALLIVGPAGPAFAALPRKDLRLTMTVPLSLICQLRSARGATLTLFDDEAGTDGAWAPVPLDIDALDGAKPLFNEACPLGPSTRR